MWRYDAQNHTISYGDSFSSDTFTVDGGMQRRKKTTTGGWNHDQRCLRRGHVPADGAYQPHSLLRGRP